MRAMTLIIFICMALPLWADPGNDRFKAVHLKRDGITRVTATVGDFTHAGPDLATLRPADKRLIGVAFDPGAQTFYGMTSHYVGPLDASGKLTNKLEPPPSIERLSWIGGVAFDAKANRLLIATKGGDGYLYEHNLKSGAWRIIANLQGVDIESLALDPANGMLYAVAKVHASPGRQLMMLNQHGAMVLQNPIDGPSFYDRLSPVPQLGLGADGLYLLTSHQKHPRVADQLWRLDPSSGAAERMPYNRALDLAAATWPGWPGGPQASLRVKVPVAPAFGSVQFENASAYLTPTALSKDQNAELHVVTLRHGGLQLGEYLKKIEKLKISVSDKAGVQVELTTDPEHTVQPAVIELTVEKTERPVVLALGSQTKLVWDVHLQAGAEIERVYLFGRQDSVVAGVPPEHIKQGSMALAVAWELERGGIGFDEFIATVRSETGLYESSFQGSPQAQAFSVPPIQ